MGLSNVDNTSDLDKPISTATQVAIDKKQEYLSAGLTTHPTITDNGDGSLTVESGYCNLYDNPNFTGTIKNYPLSEATIFFTDGLE